MSDRPIRVILDASAITAYTRSSIDVGEVIAEIDDEYGSAALPILCLVEAVRTIADHDRLHVLIHHAATTLIAPDPAAWQILATTYDTVGRLDAASAVVAALELRCQVLTGRPGLYAGLEDGGPIIAF